MKIVERIRKGLIVIGAFLLTIPTKVFAISPYDLTFTAQPDYGVFDPISDKSNNEIWNICKMLIIPIILLIGIIVCLTIYFKKSKNNKQRIIVAVLIAICVAVILCLVLNYIINNVI